MNLTDVLFTLSWFGFYVTFIHFIVRGILYFDKSAEDIELFIVKIKKQICKKSSKGSLIVIEASKE